MLLQFSHKFHFLSTEKLYFSKKKNIKNFIHSTLKITFITQQKSLFALCLIFLFTIRVNSPNFTEKFTICRKYYSLVAYFRQFAIEISTKFTRAALKWQKNSPKIYSEKIFLMSDFIERLK